MSVKKPSKSTLGMDCSHESVLFKRVASLLRQHLADENSQSAMDELTAAATELERFCEKNPESVHALRLVVECAFKLSDFKKARKYIAQAENVEPWNTEILIISESLYEYESHRVENPSSYVLQSKMPIGSTNVEILLKRAMGLFKLGYFDRAYLLAKLCFCMNPLCEHTLLQVVAVGSCFDPERLYRELLILFDLSVSSPYLFLSLGSVSNVLGRLEQAETWISKGLDRGPKDPYLLAMLLNELAYVIARQNKSLDKCVSIARKALETFPDRKTNGFIRDTLGVVYLKKGDLVKAIRSFREAVTKDQTTIPRFHLGMALLIDNQPDQALEELSKVAEARPSVESPHAEEMAILDRVQTNFEKLKKLLQNASPKDVIDALIIIKDLV